MKFFTPFFLLAIAGLSLANDLPALKAPSLPANIPTEDPITLISELSPQCQSALLGIVTAPGFFECVPVVQLLPILTDPTLLPSVIQDPIKNAAKLLPAVDAICSVPKCTDEGVQKALEGVTQGCADDQKSPLIQFVTAALTFYSPVRDIICFKNNKDQYCTVDTITTVLTLPPPPPDFKILGGIIDELIVAEPKFICTPCNKAILNTALDFFKENPGALQVLEKAFNIGEEELVIGKFYFFAKCGFQFLDGKVPDPSKIDPKKFTYQQAETTPSLANQNEVNLLMFGSFLASTFILN